MNACAGEFPTTVEAMEAAHLSVAAPRTEEVGDLDSIPSSTLEDVEVFGDHYVRVHWGIAEILRLCGWLLVGSVYVVVLWLAVSAVVEVWHAH